MLVLIFGSEDKPWRTEVYYAFGVFTGYLLKMP